MLLIVTVNLFNSPALLPHEMRRDLVGHVSNLPGTKTAERQQSLQTLVESRDAALQLTTRWQEAR